MKKKFNLGDINKKINGEQNKLPDTSNNHDETVKPSNENELKQTQGNDSQPQSSELPSQPSFKFSYRNISDASRPQPSAKPTAPPARKNRTYEVPAVTNTDVPPQQQSSNADEKNPVLPERFFDESEEDEESFDIVRYVGIILRRKKIVITVILIMTIFSIFRFLTGTKYYAASARLLFIPNNQEIVNDPTNISPSYNDYEKSFITHLELLKSYTVLNLVSQNIRTKLTPDQIRENLVIKQGETNGQKNDIIELSYKNPHAEIARDVLNELCKTYIDYRRDVNTQEITRLIFKFETQINKLQIELEQKESDLRLFKESNRMVQLSSETNITVSKITDIETALQKTQLELVETNDRLGILNSQIGKQDQDIVQSITFQDPLQSKLASLELELNTLSAQYSPEHYKVKTIKQQIDNLKAAEIDSLSQEAASKTLVKNPIRQSLVQDLVNLTVEKTALEGRRIAQEKIVENLNSELLKLPSLEQKYAYLERETESILQTLRMLKTKYEEAKIRRDSQESDLKFLEMAETPSKPITKVGLSNVLIGILIGIILGIAFALLLEYLDQSLKTPRDVEKELELPLLGVVPQIETEKMLLHQNTDLTKSVLEPFRALRANLKHIITQHNARSIIVCSAIKGEGKTTLSANLAITFALDGKKVLIVDADLRRSQMHTLFGINKQKGLSDYLLGAAAIDDIIKPTTYENLFIITSGERPDNPSELLGTYRFDLFLQDLYSKADIIIFDSPALLPVSDSITMAPKVDCTVMVFRTLWTPLKAAQQARSQLKRVGTRIFGGILNGVSVSRGYYPYYYGYYGYSQYKYSYDDDHPKKFSFREFGLKIEDNFKTFAKDLRFKAPHYISIAGILGKKLAKQKLFWILLILFLGLAAALFYFDSRPVTTPDDTIHYLGIGGVREENSSDNVISKDMAMPQSDSRLINSDSPVNVKIDTATLENSGIRDSVNRWFKARTQRDLKRFLSFYNSQSFKFSGGSYHDWENKVSNEFVNTTEKSSLIDTIMVGKRGTSYIETIVNCFDIIKTDTTKINFELVWQISNNGWKIIGEKATTQE